MYQNQPLLNLLVRFALLFLQGIMGMITNRILETEGRGIVAVLGSWQTVLFALCYLSIPFVILNQYPLKVFKDKAFVGNAFLAALLLGCSALGLGVCVWFLCPDWLGNAPVYLFFISLSAIPFLMFQAFILALLQIKGKFFVYNLLLILPVLISLIPTLTLIISGNYTVQYAIFLNVFNGAVAACTSVWILGHLGILKPAFNKLLFQKFMTSGLVIHFSAWVMYAISRIDLLMVNYYVGSGGAGVYFLAIMVVSSMVIIPGTVHSIMFYQYEKAEQEAKILRLFMVCRITFTLMLILSIIISASVWVIVMILGGASFLGAIPLILLMLPGITFWSIPIVLASAWTHIGRFKEVNFLSGIQFVMLIGLNVWLIPVMGAKGAGFSYSLVYITGTLLNLYFIRNYIPLKSMVDVFFIRSRDLNRIRASVRDVYLGSINKSG